MAEEPTNPPGFPDKGVRARLYSRLDAQDRVLNEIKTALIGDQFGNRGLVQRVHLVEADHEGVQRALAAKPNLVEFEALAKKVEGHDRKLWFGITLVSGIWGIIVAFKEQLFGHK